MSDIELEKLLAERERLLKNNPELAAFQGELESSMDDMGELDPIERALIMNKKMLELFNDRYLKAVEKIASIHDQVNKRVLQEKDD